MLSFSCVFNLHIKHIAEIIKLQYLLLLCIFLW